MISDSLSIAIADIDYYLNDAKHGIYYTGQVKNDLLKLVEDMMSILETLDTPEITR